jgi:DMSO/TMAO reductase YedYZ molybdopterin-dependent catalytic subunit
MTVTPRRAGFSGTVATAVALGVGELLAGIFDGVPSPLSAIGAWVVTASPSAVTKWAIRAFGTADKLLLGIGTGIVALIVGWFAGRVAVRRFAAGAAVFVGFGLVGIVAGLGEPLVSPTGTLLAGIVAAGAGVGSLRLLLDAAAEPDAPTDGLVVDPRRRRFVVVAGAGVAFAAVAGGVGRSLLGRAVVPTPVGVPPVTTTPRSVLIADGHDFDEAGLTPIVLPDGGIDFYRIDTALVVPRVDATTWQMRITGLVDRDVALTYQDLLVMDHIDRYVTIACVSNEVGGDLVGNALWTGPRLSEVLDRAGVRPESTQLVGRSVDGWTAGFPTGAAFDDREAMIALYMNGEPLPRRHGYPARLIVPGLYGYVSATKWLAEIELTLWDSFDAYWVPRGWSKEAPIKLQSRIDTPRSGERVAAGSVVVAGVAWAPTIGVDAVEIRIDDGPWLATETSVPLADTAWVQWRTAVDLETGRHTVRVRATDANGMVQTDVRRRPDPDGATGHHAVMVSAA